MIRRRGRRLRRSVLFLRPGHPAGFSGGCGGHVVAVVVLLVLVALRRLLRLPGVREPQVRFAGVHVVSHTISSPVPRPVPLHFVSSLKLKRYKTDVWKGAFIARWVWLGSSLRFVSSSFRKSSFFPDTLLPSSDDERIPTCTKQPCFIFHTFARSMTDGTRGGLSAVDVNVGC